MLMKAKARFSEKKYIQATESEMVEDKSSHLGGFFMSSIASLSLLSQGLGVSSTKPYVSHMRTLPFVISILTLLKTCTSFFLYLHQHQQSDFFIAYADYQIKGKDFWHKSLCLY